MLSSSEIAALFPAGVEASEECIDYMAALLGEVDDSEAFTEVMDTLDTCLSCHGVDDKTHRDTIISRISEMMEFSTTAAFVPKAQSVAPTTVVPAQRNEPTSSATAPVPMEKDNKPESKPTPEQEPAVEQPSSNDSFGSRKLRDTLVYDTEVQATLRTSRYYLDTTSASENMRQIELVGITLLVKNRELLNYASLTMWPGRKYALTGRNGVGKSTLLTCIANGKLAGFPEHVKRYLLPQQGVDTSNFSTVLDVILSADTVRADLLFRINILEEAMASHDMLSVKKALDDLKMYDMYVQCTSNQIVMFRADELARKNRIATFRSRHRGKLAMIEFKQAEMTATATLDQAAASAKSYNAEDAAQAQQMLAQLYSELETHGDAEIVRKAKNIIADLGFKNPDADPTALSGGWLTKLGLGQSLLIDADLLMLDEPTNNLDLGAIIWLEEWLKNNWSDKIALIVSHDRAFLNDVCTDTVEVRNAQLKHFPGSYDEFEEIQEQKSAHKSRLMSALEKKRKHVQQSIQNCTQKGKKSHDDKKLNQAASRKKKLNERMVGLEKREDGKKFRFSYDLGYSTTKRLALTADVPDKPVTFTFKMADPLRTSAPPLSIRNVSFSYDGKRSVLKDVSFDIDQTGIYVIMGLNGSGKSTLMKILTGGLNPTSGEVIKDSRLKIGYFPQQSGSSSLFFNSENSTPIELIQSKYGTDEQETRRALGSFGLGAYQVVTPINKLSGGERARVVMSCMYCERPHFLVMDEPTNDLDHDSIEALAEALVEWEGTVIIVSHDRRFITELGDANCYVVQRNGHVEFVESIEEFEERLRMHSAK